MKAPLALIFDVDGTLADTESAHREAFNEAFAAEGLGWTWSEALYTRLLATSGGHERLRAYWREVEQRPIDNPLLTRVHATKTRSYVAKITAKEVPLRPGVLRLIREACELYVPLAIATTTSPANVDALLRAPLGPRWRDMFSVVADASTVLLKKPDPQVYLEVLKSLAMPPQQCVAFEDSHNGLASAREAGIQTIVTPTVFTHDHDFAGAAKILPDLSSIRIEALVKMVSSHGAGV